MTWQGVSCHRNLFSAGPIGDGSGHGPKLMQVIKHSVNVRETYQIVLIGLGAIALVMYGVFVYREVFPNTASIKTITWL